VTIDVAIVGAGPAGLAAAARCARLGLAATLFDEQSAPGGSLLAEPGGAPRARALAADAQAAGVTLVADATAIAYYPEDLLDDAPGESARGGAPGLLAVTTPGALARGSAPQDALPDA